MLNRYKITFIIIRYFLLLPVFFFSSCFSDEANECDACYEPHQNFYVTIIDSLGWFVPSLSITVKDTFGNVLHVPQSTISSAHGQYTLIDADYIDLRKMCDYTQGVDILFSATNSTKSIQKKFRFQLGDDLCNCTIHLVDSTILIFN